MVDQPMIASWSMAGLPPAYVERTWRAEVPAALRHQVDDLAQKARFFDLPENLGGNPDAGRDMGTYSITLEVGPRKHTVRFSDGTQTNELAALRSWLIEHLASTAQQQ
jgi:emfourin